MVMKYISVEKESMSSFLRIFFAGVAASVLPAIGV